MERRPLVVVVGGPNGAGKTTTAPDLLKGALAVEEFVNADPIALGLSQFQPQTVEFAAGRIMLARLKLLARTRRDFAFETTLASRTFAPWLWDLKITGYSVHLMFLTLLSAELAVARVAERVRQGGHDVPEAVVLRRFTKGLRNFFGLYQPLAESWQVFDNSQLTGPRLVASGRGATAEVLDEKAWTQLKEMRQ